MLGEPQLKPPTPLYKPLLGEALTAALNSKRVVSTGHAVSDKPLAPRVLHTDIRAALDGLRDDVSEAAWEDEEKVPSREVEALLEALHVTEPIRQLAAPLSPVEPLRLHKKSTRRKPSILKKPKDVAHSRNPEASIAHSPALASRKTVGQRPVVRISKIPGAGKVGSLRVSTGR